MVIEFEDDPDLVMIDTKEGIGAFLGSLEVFTHLLQLRHEAGYTHEKRMNTWYVLGRFMLDSCGNCCKAHEFVPADHIENFPAVCTHEEFWAELNKFDVATKPNLITREEMDDPDFKWPNDRPYPTSVSFGMGSESHPAPADLLCPHCMKGWTLKDCHDIRVINDSEVLPAGEFIGKSAVDMAKYLDGHTKTKIYNVQWDRGLQNDKHIDLTIDPDDDYAVKYKIVKNERGWVKFDPDAQTYVLQEGDKVHFNTWTYFHIGCYQGHLNAEIKAEFIQAMADADFEFSDVEDVENKYGSESYRGQWHIFETHIGRIRIGWRKRVIEIDWSKTGKNFVHLFPDENVTKDRDHIHAYGLEKLTEYLKKINDSITETA